MDTRGSENEIIGRQDEKMCLFNEEERSHFSKATLQNVEEDITEKETHTAVLQKEDRTYGF